MKQQGTSFTASFRQRAWFASFAGVALATVLGGPGCGRTTALTATHADAEADVASGSGGSSASGGTASGGVVGSGGSTASGGNIGSGGSVSRGGAGGFDAGATPRLDGSGVDTTGPDATGIGILDSDFCTGGASKVSHKGQALAPLATNYHSEVGFEWGLAFGINLRTTAALGFDLQVEVLVGVGAKAGDYIVGQSAPLTATARTSGEPAQNGHHVVGSIRLSDNPLGNRGARARLCLEVDEAASALLGARIYLPDVMLEPDDPWMKRLQLFGLEDATLTSQDVATSELSSLVLAASPLLQLSDIAFYEQSAGQLGLNPAQKIGEWLRTKLGRPSLYGVPFVVVADNERVYLGSFMTGVSSVGSVGPTVIVEDIAADGLVIGPPWGRGTPPDPRNDPRILQALSETGKLLP